MPIRSVAIGSSVLTVGAPGGTLITPGTRLSADAETADPARLEEALSRPDEGRTIGELTEQSVMTASEATDRVEQAADLLGDALAGKLVDLDRAGQVLDVLQRLDEDGRYDEWLRYARSVHGVLVLLKRWAELLRLLRTLLRSGDQVHEAGLAWAQHELGTLQLAAGDAKEAARLLEQARSTRERLGDADGLAATEQSLGVLCRRQASGGSSKLGRVAALLALAVLLLAVGGVAGAMITQPDDDSLNVTVEGRGVVRAASAGIRCPDRCDAELDRGAEVTLTARARRGATFEGWSGGGCEGTGPCEITVRGAVAVTARFAQADEARVVSVRKSGDGTGRVTGPSGIDCGGTCEARVERGDEVELDATADERSSFAGWSGAGCGEDPTCTFVVDDPVTVTAEFTAEPVTFLLTVATDGEGTVTGDGIDCGEDCEESFDEGTSVELTAALGGNNNDVAWSGCAVDGTEPLRCVATMSEDVDVSATFSVVGEP
jgi:hypothetical protein